MDNENEIKRVKDRQNSKASRFKGMTTDMKKDNDSEDKNKILSSKMSKFGKGFKIPDDKTDKQHKRKKQRNDV
jgi:hypothetical protein